MTAVVPYRPLEDIEVPSPLPRGRGLLDPEWIPFGFHRRDHAREILPVQSRAVTGKLAIAYRLVVWSVRFLFRRRFRPSLLPASGKDAGRLFAEFQGFWFELGRLLSQRSEFLPAEVRRELAVASAPLRAREFADVRAIVEEELGIPLRITFSEFDEMPFHVGMYSDTYRARLRREGVEVAVKVQRPDLERRLRRDIRIFRLMASFFRRLEAQRHIAWDDVISTFEERIPSLLDLRYEASSIRRMRRSLRDHKIYVPKLFRAYSRKRLIVQEHLDAPTLLELGELMRTDPLGAEGWLRANEIDPAKSARRLYHSMLRQICEDNLFQQDLGPANIVLLREGRLGLLSCDSTTTVDKRFLTIFNLAVGAMTRDDYEKFADTLFLLCESLPVSDLSAVRSQVIRAVRSYAGRSVLGGATHEEKSLFVLTSELALILHTHGILLDWQALKLMAAMASADASIVTLYRGMNYRKELDRYGKKAAGRRIRNVVRGGVGNAVGGVVMPLMEMLRFETASMRKRAQNFRASTGEVAYVFATITRWLARAVVVGAIVGIWIFLHQHHIELLEPFHHTAASKAARQTDHIHYGWWITIFIGSWIVYGIARDIARRLAAREVDVTNT